MINFDDETNPSARGSLIDASRKNSQASIEIMQMEPQISKLQPKVFLESLPPPKSTFEVKKASDISMEKPLIRVLSASPPPTAPMLLFALNSKKSNTSPVLYYNTLRHQFTNSKTLLQQQGFVMLKQAGNEKSKQTVRKNTPNEENINASQKSIRTSNNLRKYRYGVLPPEKAKILAKELGPVSCKGFIQKPVEQGNDVDYFNTIFPATTPKQRSPMILVDKIESTNGLERAYSFSSTDYGEEERDLEGKLIVPRTPNDRSAKVTAVRNEAGSDYKYRFQGSVSHSKPLYTPASFRRPGKVESTINFDTDSPLIAKKLQEGSTVVTETNESNDIDRNSFDDVTKEAFFLRGKISALIADSSNHSSVEIAIPSARKVSPATPKIFSDHDSTSGAPSSPGAAMASQSDKNNLIMMALEKSGAVQATLSTNDGEAKQETGIQNTRAVSSQRKNTSKPHQTILQCSHCLNKQASLWCRQCSAAYCGICWIRSPAHTKSNLVPVPSFGAKPPYLSIDTFSEATHVRMRIAPNEVSPPRSSQQLQQTQNMEGVPSPISNHRITLSGIDPSRNEFGSSSPPRRSTNFLHHKHEFERRPATKPRELQRVAEYHDYPLPPVFIDPSGTVHHFQHKSEIRPQTTPDFRTLRTNNGTNNSRVNSANEKEKRRRQQQVVTEEGSDKYMMDRDPGPSSPMGGSPFSSPPSSPKAGSPRKNPNTSRLPNRQPQQMLVYNALRTNPQHQQQSLSESSGNATEANKWLNDKKPLKIRVTAAPFDDDEVPPAFAIAGASGGAIQVAYSAKPALHSRPKSPTNLTIALPKSEEVLGVSGVIVGGGGTAKREKEFQIMGGTAVFVKPAGFDEKEEFLLKEIRTLDEKEKLLHTQPFRLP